MKKLLSLLLSLALCLSILPTAAFAAEGSGNTASNKKNIFEIFCKKRKHYTIYVWRSPNRVWNDPYAYCYTPDRALCNCRIFCRNRLVQDKSIEI